MNTGFGFGESSLPAGITEGRFGGRTGNYPSEHFRFNNKKNIVASEKQYRIEKLKVLQKICETLILMENHLAIITDVQTRGNHI